MSDLLGNHIVGFATRRLISISIAIICDGEETAPRKISGMCHRGGEGPWVRVPEGPRSFSAC